MKVKDLTSNPNSGLGVYISPDERVFSGQAERKVALALAELKGKIVKRKATNSDLDFWQSIPTVSVDTQVGDVVKDYSINSDGQAGSVVDVREMKKRTGDIVIVVEFVFYGHTNLKDERTRKIRFKK